VTGFRLSSAHPVGYNHRRLLARVGDAKMEEGSVMGSKDIRKEVKKPKKKGAENKAKPSIAPQVPTIRDEKKK
jgi:hypothetical protein